MDENCPVCSQPLPKELQWSGVRQRPDGNWEANVRMGRWAGWAVQKTEQLAREKALARLYYYKDLVVT
jgi:hypothetical protein